jgi:hypothetical protein
MRRAIVVEHVAALNRQIGQQFLRVAGRIAVCQHDLGHQAVGFGNGLGRRVDKARLGGAPLGGMARALLGRQRPNIELGHTLLAGLQIGLGLALVAGLLERALIFGAKAPAQVVAAAPLCPHVDARRQHNNSQDHQYSHNRRIHDSVSSTCQCGLLSGRNRPNRRTYLLIL